VCPWNGGLNWALNTPWNGQNGFKNAAMRDWSYQGKTVGQWKQFRNFQFVKVFEAGHMTPTDQPEVSLELFTNFIFHRPFGTQ
jgi:cathepsin A (carboxypeptidase C)